MPSSMAQHKISLIGPSNEVRQFLDHTNAAFSKGVLDAYPEWPNPWRDEDSFLISDGNMLPPIALCFSEPPPPHMTDKNLLGTCASL